MGDAMLLRTKQRGDAILFRANKRVMLYFSEQTNGGCYASQNIQTGDAMLLRTTQTRCYTSESIQTRDAIFLRTKQTGDAMLLRTYKRGMIYFSEQTNGG
jgi:hypothetical protein